MQVDVKVLNESSEGEEDNDFKRQKLEELENVEKLKGRIIMVGNKKLKIICILGYRGRSFWFGLGITINSNARSFEINLAMLRAFFIKLKRI